MDYKAFEILDSLPYTILVADKQGVCVWHNMHSERLFSSPQKNKHMQDIFPKETDLISAVKQVANTDVSMRVNMQDLTASNTDGTRYMAWVNQHDGYLIISIIDTPIFNQGVSESLHRLVAMLAHEIKNPLSGIRGASQLLDTGEQGNLASLITQETDRISNLVNDLENLSDLKNIAFASVNIHQILDDVVSLAQTGFANRCHIIKQYDPSLPNAFGEKHRLLQVFLNLIKNASEAMDGVDNRKIIISTSYAQGVSLTINDCQYRAIRVDIRDTGCGISDMDKHNIFAPYITDKTGGKGLGLSVVSSIISSHGGRVSFDTSSDGTTFSIILPMEHKIKSKNEGMIQ